LQIFGAEFSLDAVPIALYKAILCVMVAIGSAVSLFAPFARKYRDASGWLRSVWFIGSALLLTWSTLTLYRMAGERGDHSLGRPERSRVVSRIESGIGGVGAGMLLALVTSPEFRRRSARRSQASNSPMKGVKCGE